MPDLLYLVILDNPSKPIVYIQDAYLAAFFLQSEIDQIRKPSVFANVKKLTAIVKVLETLYFCRVGSGKDLTLDVKYSLLSKIQFLVSNCLPIAKRGKKKMQKQKIASFTFNSKGNK